jgi:DNA polymerase/3'-5' exonuclease PolX
MKSHINQISLHRWVVWLIIKKIAYALDLKKYVISGSYRRGKTWINDIDLLISVNSDEEANGIKLRLAQLGWTCHASETDLTLRNQFIKKINNKILVLDVFFSLPGTWGNCTLFTTGSKFFNDAIRSKLLSMGYHWDNPRYFTRVSNGSKVSFLSERGALDFLNIKWIKPSKRVRYTTVNTN